METIVKEQEHYDHFSDRRQHTGCRRITSARVPCGTQWRKGRESPGDLKERGMLDQMILTVSNVERSLAFYKAALKPLNIKFVLPYKGRRRSS